MTKIHPLYKTAFQSDAYHPLANRTAVGGHVWRRGGGMRGGGKGECMAGACLAGGGHIIMKYLKFLSHN